LVSLVSVHPSAVGNLHRVFLCEMKNGLPHPVATITQRDVARILLIYLGLTLQGEVSGPIRQCSSPFDQRESR